MAAPVQARGLIVFSLALVVTVALIVGYSSTADSAPCPASSPYSHYFSGRCSGCHTNDSITCNGCHEHGDRYLTAIPHKSSYAPGEEVIVNFYGGEEYGWVRGMLVDMTSTEVDRLTGPTLMGNDGGPQIEFPMELKGRAPGRAGNHTWTAKYFGNRDGSGHSDVDVPFTINVAATADVVVDVIPSTSPLFFPSSGGTLDCTVVMENTTASYVPFVAAIYVRTPSGLHYGPILGWVNITLPAGGVITPSLSIALPGSAPTGVYSLNVYVGDPATSTLIDADSFDFVKEP